MSASRRRRGPAHEEEEENSERWTVSYMDMVTVMMCLFIVLFAISQVDQQKFDELRHSLAAGFGETAPATGILDGTDGVLDAADVQPKDDPASQIEGNMPPGPLDAAALETAARGEANDLAALRDQIRADLEAIDLEGEVRMAITERGLVVGLVTENTYFSPASAAMPQTTLDVVDAIAETLEPLPNDILLEGHANTLPYTGAYETNWEISADRATKVLRRMVEHGDIAPDRVRAVGYGDAYPAVTEGPDALDLNRRVDVVVLSDQPEQVRQLLPELAQSVEGA